LLEYLSRAAIVLALPGSRERAGTPDRQQAIPAANTPLSFLFMGTSRKVYV